VRGGYQSTRQHAGFGPHGSWTTASYRQQQRSKNDKAQLGFGLHFRGSFLPGRDHQRRGMPGTACDGGEFLVFGTGFPGKAGSGAASVPPETNQLGDADSRLPQDASWIEGGDVCGKGSPLSCTTDGEVRRMRLVVSAAVKHSCQNRAPAVLPILYNTTRRGRGQDRSKNCATRWRLMTLLRSFSPLRSAHQQLRWRSVTGRVGHWSGGLCSGCQSCGVPLPWRWRPGQALVNARGRALVNARGQALVNARGQGSLHSREQTPRCGRVPAKASTPGKKRLLVPVAGLRRTDGDPACGASEAVSGSVQAQGTGLH
jgi:hypothetical protein